MGKYWMICWEAAWDSSIVSCISIIISWFVSIKWPTNMLMILKGHSQDPAEAGVFFGRYSVPQSKWAARSDSREYHANLEAASSLPSFWKANLNFVTHIQDCMVELIYCAISLGELIRKKREIHFYRKADPITNPSRFGNQRKGSFNKSSLASFSKARYKPIKTGICTSDGRQPASGFTWFSE